MFASHIASPHSSSSSPSLFCPTIFRVRRKRTADPHGALVISLKRSKQISSVMEPIICFRASPSNMKLEFGAVSDSRHFNIIDVDLHQSAANTVKPSSSNIDGTVENSGFMDDISCCNPLELLQDSVDESLSSSEMNDKVTIKSSQITINGEPLVVLSGQNDEDFIFDYYWSSKADGCTASEIRDVRLAEADDLLWDGEDTESSAGDDEDSNDENNWRNDYPDESEHTSGCGSDEDTASFDFDYDDLERHIGEMGFYDKEDSESDED